MALAIGGWGPGAFVNSLNFGARVVFSFFYLCISLLNIFFCQLITVFSQGEV